ncbi:hypothetical protein [Commensalibacter oyaizuii]|uniref:Tetratricopeptide repeat protein n=1 Tax=Commensalibacter oyaizuii TaxID=3043873 RepID=A0ABT6Q338_9PROT|nr:hypothetical protein [Commensalibacter sp. TBRC 16381]MDI2091543.1 hypothetical protein [Commensalibacter sp. TBRC 16381]
MNRSIKVSICVVGIMALTSTIAISCAVVFPWQLLDNRKKTLLDMPDIDSFSKRMKNLVAIDAKEKQNLLSADHVDSSWNKSTCPQTDNAYQQAASLYHNKQWDEAYNAFALLAYNSPPAQQVCAKYTLGLIEFKLNRYEDAAQSFSGVAYLVAHGAPDPLHLGIAAYGQAAGAILDQIGIRDYNAKSGLVTWQVGDLKEDSLLQLQRAVNLYAKQASVGENQGIDSIAVIIDGLTNPQNEHAKALLEQAVANPLLRKVLLAYVLTGDQDYKSYSKERMQNILHAFLKAAETQKDPSGDFSRLAVLAYQNNDFEKAQTLAEYDWKKHEKALDAWVLAKIALTKGDKEKAQEYYHQAITHLNDDSLPDAARKRIQGEQSVLTLSQGNFVQALITLWPVRDIYWGDVVYLAENVLTIDELKRFADQYAVVTATTSLTPKDQEYNDDYTLNGRVWAFRDLVGQRLVRANRFEEAKKYLVRAETRKWVDEYVKALDGMRHNFWATNRAKAAWNAANIIYHHGMEMSGTAGYPDQNPGFFAYGISQITGPNNKQYNKAWSIPDEQNRTNASWPIPNRRFHYRYIAIYHVLYATSLVPPQSQAYAAMLCQANGWMQQTSNYASMTFQNTNTSYSDTANWVDDSKFAYSKSRELYNLYLRHGPAVPFATHFGQNCPAPEFDKIASLKSKLLWQDIRHSFRFLKGQ